MNTSYTSKLLALVALLAISRGTNVFAQSTTTKQAAEAAKQQGSTGSSNENASRQLNNLEKEQAAQRNATPTATPTKK